MGVELHAAVVRTAACRQADVGCSAITLGRSAASLLRGCACGLPAVIDVGPLWGPHCTMVPFRRFAFGSPAVIKSSPPMGAQASRCDYGRRRTLCRMGSPITLSAPRLFNTENRLFSRARSLARIYAKIRNISFSDTSLRRPAAGTPGNTNFATMCHKSPLIFLRKLALDVKFHPLDRRIDGMEMDFHGMDRAKGRTDAQKSRMETRESRWKAHVGRCPL